MKITFQFGYDLGLFILWRAVSPATFAAKIKPLLLWPGQFDTITGEELLPIFNDGFILRDGWRLYRGIY